MEKIKIFIEIAIKHFILYNNRVKMFLDMNAMFLNYDLYGMKDGHKELKDEEDDDKQAI